MMEWLHEAQYSLVLFTIFTQASVGAFWVLLVSDFIQRKASDRVQDAFIRIGTTILVPLTALGLLFSTTHLGRPQYAFRALGNVGTSWLSREIVAFGLFFVLVAVYTYLWRRRVPDAELRRIVGVLTGIVGVLALISQAMVYQVPGRPMWDHLSTLALFGLSGLLLGPLAVASVYSLMWGRAVSLREGEATVRISHRRLGITLLGVAAAYAGALVWRLNFLAAGAAAAAGDGRFAGKAAMGKETVTTALLIGHEIVQQNGGMLTLQIVGAIAVPALLAVGLWLMHKRQVSLKLCNLLVAGTLVLALAGELAGRALFYLSGRPWF